MTLQRYIRPVLEQMQTQRSDETRRDERNSNHANSKLTCNPRE
jgi:hypothetical protein